MKISATSEFVSAYQYCYVDDKLLLESAAKLSNYIVSFNRPCYLEFGNKEGNYTPAFSMSLLPADMSGHVKIEVDIEIDDNKTRCHRCCYYILCELGQIQRLGIGLKEMAMNSEKMETSLLG